MLLPVYFRLSVFSATDPKKGTPGVFFCFMRRRRGPIQDVTGRVAVPQCANRLGVAVIFSRTAVHGIYAICYMSRQRSRDVIPSATVAAALGITVTHAAKVLKRLATAGVISSIRGRRGGYALTRKMAEIPVVEVLDALNPAEDKSRVAAVKCGLGRSSLCTAHRGLVRLEDRMRSALARETLGGLAGSVCSDEDAVTSLRMACRSKRVRECVTV